jgi:phosphoglycolate phosphatase-like HAD superfamily hydrolase
MVPPTILLFDIDGTLITSGGVGRRAVSRAFQRAYGRADACQHLRFDGLTDRLIARQGLAAIGIEPDERTIDAWIEVYLAELEAELAACDGQSYRVHRGVEAALAAAAARGLALGLGTGNVRAGARLKLEHVALYGHFAFGGFGCDHETRSELIRRGAERGADLLGQPLARCRVVIIGDTPKDIAAAIAIGAECIGVGTGAYSAAVLQEQGATHAFDDLQAPGALAALLGE